MARILTTHAGSLPRPEKVAALHAASSRGVQIDTDELAREAELGTRDVIAKQIEAGVDVLNNGEVGRESFFTYVRHRMTGFGGQSNRPGIADLFRYPDFLEELVRRGATRESVSLLRAPRAQGEVTYRGPEPIENECAQLRSLLEEHAGRYTDAFVSSASPGIIATAMENAYYDDLESYVQALGRALQTEYRAIVGAGLVLQIDAPDLAMERHTLFKEKPLGEFLAFTRSVIGAINSALDGLPRERARLHVCWGNYEGPHDVDVELGDIWSEVSRAHVGGFLLSMANPRHAHEIRLFERGILPEGAQLVPGVIDTTTNYVEHPETVADRIERAARAVGDPERILAGTDCGFETSAGFASVVPDVVWAKLHALSEGARLASKRIFG